MSDLRELYQEVILDHGHKKPRNFRVLAEPYLYSEGHNPLCGDRLTVYLRLEEDRVKDISFQGSGCAISKASASLMTEVLKGKSKEEAEAIFESFHKLVTGKPTDDADMHRLGKLAVFAGVRDFPVRVKCATLAWHTVHAALRGQADKPVSTE
ncbi:MAG: Fe-S cluster assembly sulfur transfer protein SufU [Gemmataceae bacterium]